VGTGMHTGPPWYLPSLLGSSILMFLSLEWSAVFTIFFLYLSGESAILICYSLNAEAAWSLTKQRE
jgi:hypothetical protein